MTEPGIQSNEFSIQHLASVVMQASEMLLRAGANTNRIRNTIDRIANSYGYSVDFMLADKIFAITLADSDNKFVFSSTRKTPPTHINFSLISYLSIFSWAIETNNWSLIQLEEELDKIVQEKPYPKCIVTIMVAFAGASFCALVDGSMLDILFCFFASAVGYLVKRKAIKLNFNSHLAVFFASLVASLIAGFAAKIELSDVEKHAFVTSVLFLIPGVSLINSFTEIIEGNIQNGISSGINGFLVSLSIALGVLTTKFIYQF